MAAAFWRYPAENRSNINREIESNFTSKKEIKKMDRKELEAKVIELVATTFNKDESTLTVDTRIKEDLGGASLLMVGLVSEIENELDVLVQLQVAAACQTIGELVDKVEEQM